MVNLISNGLSRSISILIVSLVYHIFYLPAMVAQHVYSNDYLPLCYSCMAVPPLFTNVNSTQLREHLLVKAFDPHTNRTIRLPAVSSDCRETHVTAQGQFEDVTKYMCETGACVKLKGYFQGEPYVVRECWNRLWDRRRDNKWHGCAPVSFLADTETEICICSVDLCNLANAPKSIPLFTCLSFFIFIVPLVSSLL